MPHPDPFKFTTIAHTNRALCNPTSAATIREIFSHVKISDGASVLDVGCGKGEMLIMLAEMNDINGVGVDINPAFLDIARQQSQSRVPNGTLDFILSPVNDYPIADASLDVLICVGSTHVFGGLKQTLETASQKLRPGGYVMIGEGFWRRTPNQEYLDFLETTIDEFGDSSSVAQAALDKGFQVVTTTATTDDEWDEYESSYAQAVLDYIAANLHDPDSASMLDRIRKWNDGYLKWGRTTLGFGLDVFRKSR